MDYGNRYGRGFTLWFTGLSGAGKTTIAGDRRSAELREKFGKIEVLDGDIVRTNLSKGLTFSLEDRNINVLRIGFVANLLTRNGIGVIVSAISPYKEARDEIRRGMDEDFLEVFVDAPLDCLRRAGRKGSLQKGVRRGDQGVHRRLRSLRAARGPGTSHKDRRGRAAGQCPPGHKQA